MRKISSIRKKIVMNTVSMVMILSVVFLCVLFLTSRIMTNLILLDVMQPLVRTASQAVEANLHVLSDRVFMISDNRAFTDAGTTKDEKKALLENAASGIEFISLSLYTPDGKLYTSYGDGAPDISQRELYRHMKETGGLVVDDTSVNAGNLQVAIGTPVTDADGTVAYYLVGDYKYDVLNDVVSNINIGYTGRALMFNQDGVLMAHSSAEKVRAQENIYTAYSGGDKLKNLFERAMTGEIGASRVHINGKACYMTFAPVRGTNWSIAITVPQSEFMDAGNGALQITLLITVAMLFILVLRIRNFSGRIAHALGNVTDRIQLLSHGDLTSSTDVVRTNDEVETLSHALRETIVDINGYLSELRDALTQISNGNLDVQIQGQFQGDFVVMKESLDRIISFLNNAMHELQDASEQLLIASHGVANSAQTVNSSSETQAHSVMRLKAESETILQNINAVNDHAQQAEALMGKVKAQLDNGDQQMKQMLQSMDQINQNAHEIGKISKLMEDIAFQTNILALNASVEAARAGAAGKGFSVVAQEVRNLAEKSSESAQKATQMLEHSQEQVDEGYTYAQQTAKTMSDIADISHDVSKIMDGLVDFVQEQKTALDGMAEDIGAISDIGEQNLSASEQAAAASHEMTQQAQALQDIAGRFNLRQTQSAKQMEESIC
ncbi:methyl-accepting chemotaxis protein [Anaerotruncus colihominis]|nr:methyl-accepting chemotaxis protein [Anaerotruncus colihominis]MCR2024339.1 methyl-accepting chemotaxis protein [Anaerotruncus colihominis]